MGLILAESRETDVIGGTDAQLPVLALDRNPKPVAIGQHYDLDLGAGPGRLTDKAGAAERLIIAMRGEDQNLLIGFWGGNGGDGSIWPRGVPRVDSVEKRCACRGKVDARQE